MNPADAPHPAARLTKADYDALAAFRYELRRFLRFSEEAASAAGLAPQQHQALLAIKGFPGRDTVTVGELAERLQIRHHSAVGLVDRLVAEGLVERSASEHDRRKVFVTVTGRGLELLEHLSTAHQQELRRIGPALQSLLNAVSAK